MEWQSAIIRCVFGVMSMQNVLTQYAYTDIFQVSTQTIHTMKALSTLGNIVSLTFVAERREVER